MARDALGVLLAVRQRAVDQSRLALATCVKVETAAMEAIRVIDDAVQRERVLADRVLQHSLGMEIFATWLKRARAERLGAVGTLVAAEAQTAAARVVLAAARSARRSVERTIEERVAVARAEAEKREQYAMDDITGGNNAARRQEVDQHGE